MRNPNHSPFNFPRGKANPPIIKQWCYQGQIQQWENKKQPPVSHQKIPLSLLQFRAARMAKSYATQSSNRYRKYNLKTFGSSVLCQLWIVNFSLNSLFPIFFFKQETYSKITKWYIYNALHTTIHHTTFSQYATLSTANFSYIVPMYKTEKRTKSKSTKGLDKSYLSNCFFNFTLSWTKKLPVKSISRIIYSPATGVTQKIWGNEEDSDLKMP